MHYSLYIVVISLALLGLYALLTSRYSYFRHSANAGLSIWVTMIPLIAILVLALVVGVNFGFLQGGAKKIFSLRPYLNSGELAVLMLCIPVLAMRLGYIVSAALTVYLLERVLLGFTSPNPSIGFVIVASCLTCLSILSDKLPWLDQRRAQPTAHKFREILTLFACFAAITIIFTSLIRVPNLSRWLAAVFSLRIPPEALVGMLVVLMTGWMIVALGLIRQIILPFVLLPTVILIAFATNWPLFALAVPFVLILCLTIAVAERRANNLLYSSRSSTLFS